MDLAKDFAALMIIANFDNLFAMSSQEMICLRILKTEKEDYKNLLLIETTTSLDAMEEKNEELKTDKISAYI